MRGLHEMNGSRLYVSPGTGTWGPVLRIGSRSEITLIEFV
jgi:predicted MPP superfamily phosphohydrolase